MSRILKTQKSIYKPFLQFMSLFHVCFQLLLSKATLCAKSLASTLHGTLAKCNILEYTEMPNEDFFYMHICFILLSFKLNILIN